MNTKDWFDLPGLKKDNLSLDATWIKVVDCVPPNKILKFTAQGKWSFLGSSGATAKCGPDGFLGLPLPYERLPLPNCPIGTLIIKLGGSTADQRDGVICAIGSFAIIATSEKATVPIYLSINVPVGYAINKLDEIDCKISMADP